MANKMKIFGLFICTYQLELRSISSMTPADINIGGLYQKL